MEEKTHLSEKHVPIKSQSKPLVGPWLGTPQSLTYLVQVTTLCRIELLGAARSAIRSG